MDNLIQDIMANPPKVASFDFDDTLSFGVFKVPNSDEWFESYQVTDRRMSPIIKDIIQKLYQAGTAIYMVTSRKDTVKNRIEVTEFLKENSVLNIFKELIFVGNDKAHKLQEIGSELHFDDDNHEFKYLKQEYPNTKTEFIQIQHTLIPGEISGQEGNWTMQKLGLLAKFLKKSYPEEYRFLVKLAFVDESYKLLVESKFFRVVSRYNNDISITEFYTWLDEFMDLNSEVFLKHPLKTILGSGSYGVAFETEDGNVIKLFRGGDTYLDYVKRKKEYDSGRASKYGVEIYDIGMFNLPKYKRYPKTNDNHLLGWVVMEKLSIPEYNSIWEDLNLYVIRNMNKIYDSILTDDLYDEVYDMKLDFLKWHQLDQNISEDDIEEFIWFVVDSYLKGEDDLGYGNYGFRGNMPVGFDSNTPPIQEFKNIFNKYPEMNIEYDDDNEK